MKRTALVDEWLTALRSGEYKQGPMCLRRGDEYCCLGVLCELTGELSDVFDIDTSGQAVYQTTEGYTGILSDPQRERVGMSDHEMSMLIQQNDAQSSFVEIADTIEGWCDENVVA